MSKHVETLVYALLLIFTLFITTYFYYTLAEKLYVSEIERSGKGYVSDEVWYVNSARNILVKVFNSKPRIPNGVYGVSIVYNSSLIDITYIEKLIRENRLNVSIVEKRYYKINAVYLESRSLEDIYKLLVFLNNTRGVLDIVWGWRIGDARNINKYFNLEHPPLFKYLICLSIIILGDHPINWRIPSIVAGSLTVLFTFLTCFKLTSNKWLSLITALLTGLDPITRVMSSTGLIDIYIALFTSITMYLVVLKKFKLALYIPIIGSLFKFTSLFLILPVLVIIIRQKLRENPSVSTLVSTTLTCISISIVLFICLQIIVSVPLIKYFGFNNWFYLSFINALKWHISVKCIGEHCPVSSTPWDWFIGNKVFPLYYFSVEDSLVASGFWPFWTISLTYLILFIPIYRLDRRLAYIHLFFTTQLFSYIVLYIIGNRTQYSFYSVQFAPIVYINLIYSFTYIVFDFNKLRIVFTYWRNLFNKIWLLIIWILQIER